MESTSPPAEAKAASPGHKWLWRPNLIVFTSSACTMVLELVAGRIIAPHVGASLYTWTSVIGVVLAGISLGNYLGGLTSLGILAVDEMDILATVEWPLIVEILVLIAAMFFLPAAILGTISPVVAKLAVRDLSKTGSTVGKIYLVRVLILDRLVHSYSSLDDPTKLVYGYEKVYAEVTAYQAQLDLDALEKANGGDALLMRQLLSEGETDTIPC